MERIGSAEFIADQPLRFDSLQSERLGIPHSDGEFSLVEPGGRLGRSPRTAEEICLADHTDYLHNDSFAKYMRMHKVLVGRGGAEELVDIHEQLKSETAPRFLIAAASAAAEVALVHRGLGVAKRRSLLWDARDIWQSAIARDAFLEAYTPPEKMEYGHRHRTALNIAILPLLEGIVEGDVSRNTCRRVFRDCLDIGLRNAYDLSEMVTAKNNRGIADYVGTGYESNALLAFNRKLSRTWFAIPSMARSDSGYHHRNQSHDLLVLHQNYGEIIRATPIEVKAKASLRDRLRYDALLVRGKMHLSIAGKSKPQYTLQAIDAVHRGAATEEDLLIANNATDRLVEMVRDYYAGEKLGKLATWHTVTMFQDNSQVIAKHPGLSRLPIPA